MDVVRLLVGIPPFYFIVSVRVRSKHYTKWLRGRMRLDSASVRAGTSVAPPHDDPNAVSIPANRLLPILWPYWVNESELVLNNGGIATFSKIKKGRQPKKATGSATG